jgi:thioredoxin-dependent peroxiredoxin
VEGQGLRDSAHRFRQAGVTILGASFDSPAENLAFSEAQRFPFRLLSDMDRTVGAAYEVSRPAGDPYEAYPRRYSYLIDPDGLIRRGYDVADVAGHAAEVLADVATLQAA